MKQQPLKASDVKPENSDDKTQELVETIAVASAVLTVIEDVVPKLNNLVEQNILTISDSFSKIAATSKTMAKHLAQTPEAKPLMDEIEKNVAMAIMGMQFQDRLSQNLVIIKNISETLNSTFKSAINLQQSKNTSGNDAINIDLGKKILENLKLGEVREIYIDFLSKSGLIKDPSILGYKAATEEANKQEDDVELF